MITLGVRHPLHTDPLICNASINVVHSPIIETTPLILQQWAVSTPYFWTRPWVTKYCTVIFLRLACSHVRARSVLTDARVASIIREAHTSTLPSTHAGDCGGRSLLAYLEMGHPRALCSHSPPRPKDCGRLRLHARSICAHTTRPVLGACLIHETHHGSTHARGSPSTHAVFPPTQEVQRPLASRP